MRTLDKSWTAKDFKIRWFSGTGAGGQHRNKHQNCVEITHVESGLTARGQSSKSRHTNFREAFETLAQRLKDHYYPQTQKRRNPVTDIIRTYNESENRVVDHLSSDKQTWKQFDLDRALIGRKKFS